MARHSRNSGLFLSDMLVGVCDFPSAYTFPPYGYGGIERWLWAAAVGARQTGAEVHLLGPRWRPELADEWPMLPLRLEDVAPSGRPARGLRDAGYDLLVVGHEYPSLPAWRTMWQTLDADVVTFQHWPYFTHLTDAFDGVRSRLYCYSEEMRARYAVHRPISELAVHLGMEEVRQPLREGRHLLWMGRIDAQKAPHLAVRAAQILGRAITVAGPVFDPFYVQAHRDLFGASHVAMTGEVGSTVKTSLLAEAGTVVYTCAPSYIEAGAAIFGESLRAGTPVAALAWRRGSCAHAALCEQTGSVALADERAGEEAAAEALAAAIEQLEPLRAREVQEMGLTRFNPARHFRALAFQSC